MARLSFVIIIAIVGITIGSASFVTMEAIDHLESCSVPADFDAVFAVVLRGC